MALCSDIDDNIDDRWLYAIIRIIMLCPYTKIRMTMLSPYSMMIMHDRDNNVVSLL